MKKIIPILLLCFFYLCAYPQKTISGKSETIKFSINPTYERGLPPNLFISMDFVDQDNDGLLEADETAMLTLTITNNGKGNAQGLYISVKDDQNDPAMEINDGRTIPFLAPGQNINVRFPIIAGRDVKNAEHKLKILVTEHFGYDTDPAFLVLNTLAYQKAELIFNGLDVVDAGIGTAGLNEDGQLQPGEMVKAKIVIQNIGQNVSKNTTYHIKTTDENIYLSDNAGDLGDIAIGEVKEFWVTISPNKRVQSNENLPLFLDLKNEARLGELNDFNLPIQLNQKPPEPVLLTVHPDLEVNRKEIARFEYNSNRITAKISNVTDVKQVPPSSTKRPNSIAIVIGVEKYRNFINAPYASNDANLMEDYFKNVFGINQVFKYTNEDVIGFFFDNLFNPDYGELKKAIVQDETEIFVFYSGHGMPSKDGEKVYLFPSDGKIEAIERQGFNINKLYDNLAELGAKSVTLFIDACFSGVTKATESFKTENLIAMKGVAIKPKISQPWVTNPNFSVYSSSAFNQTSLGFDESETGLFTYSVCAGLQGKADVNGDNKITAGELADFVQKRVEELSVKIHGLQTPQFNGNRDLVLGEY